MTTHNIVGGSYDVCYFYYYSYGCIYSVGFIFYIRLVEVEKMNIDLEKCQCVCDSVHLVAETAVKEGWRYYAVTWLLLLAALLLIIGLIALNRLKVPEDDE